MTSIESQDYKKVEEKIGKPTFDKVFSKLDPESKKKILETINNNSQITKESLKELIKDMFREKNRKAQFENILKNGTEKQKKIFDKKNIETISASDLLIGESEGLGFLAKTFAYKIVKDESGEQLEIPLDIKDIREKDIIKIDFGKNKNADYKIGAGDMLPTNIKVIKVRDIHGNERIGVRSVGKKSNGYEKVGYYDKSGYIPIFSGYIIEIPTKEESEKIIKDLSKDVEISNDENKEKEIKEKFLEMVKKEEEREDKIRSFNLEANKSFMENTKLLALEIEKVYGIPWQVTAGQASLESGWGKSGLSIRDNNYFGIKASKGWNGKVSSWDTTEYDKDDTSHTEKANFRSYSDMKESFIDYAKFLIYNPRYRQAFKYALNLDPKPDYYPSDYVGYNPEKFIEEIASAGYATDPKYASLVKKTWAKYDALETKQA